MKITPIDIAHKNFNRKMFGLDDAEVNDFLQQVATQLEELTHERNTLKEALRQKEILMNDQKEKDHVLKSTISTAGQMADRLRTDAEREARLIITDAQQKAEMITRDARDSLKKAYQEISDLKRVRLQFEANLKALAQAHLSLLDQGDKFMPNIGMNNIQLETPMSSRDERNSNISPLSAIP